MKHVIFRSMTPKLLGSCIRRDTEFLKHSDKQNSKAGTCHSCLSFLLFYLSFLCHHLFHPCLCRLSPCQTHPCHPYWALSPWALGGSWGWERDKHDKTRMSFQVEMTMPAEIHTLQASDGPFFLTVNQLPSCKTLQNQFEVRFRWNDLQLHKRLTRSKHPLESNVSGIFLPVPTARLPGPRRGSCWGIE